MEKTQPIGIRIRESALERVEVAAALEGVSRSRFVAREADRAARERLREIRESNRRAKGEGDGE